MKLLCGLGWQRCGSLADRHADAVDVAALGMAGLKSDALLRRAELEDSSAVGWVKADLDETRLGWGANVAVAALKSREDAQQLLKVGPGP